MREESTVSSAGGSEEALRRSEERFQRMIAEVQDYAILLLNADGIIENWNLGAEKIKGYSAEEAVGQHFRIFYPQLDRDDRLPDRLLEHARVHGRAMHEGWRMRKDGSMFWGSVVITALHDNDGQVIGFTKVTRDLTERRAAEEELKAKNRELEAINQELTSFAYVSSHDLQEPLRKIQTFSSRILELEGDNFSDKGKDYFQRIQVAASRMRKLIDDLLTYSRTTTAHNFVLTDMKYLLDDLRQEFREALDQKQAVVESSPLPRLKVIPFQIRQLFANLLGNALKFARKDVPPHISIRAEVTTADRIPELLSTGHQPYHHITVTDNGIGFDPEYNTRIFEVFQRLHGREEYEGTGVGLAICRKIVENHKGVIKADGKLNGGATFHVYLPG
jgi:PAS domain S-box-containing protein